MSERTSESAFNKGLEAVCRKEYLEALAYFEASMQLGRSVGMEPPMKYLSYYGLCLAMVSNRINEAREICETALQAEFYNPDLYLNLGRVYLRSGDRASAFDTLVRGLHLNPRHSGLVREIRRLGIRKRPVLSFLRRDNPFNRLLGRMRSSAAMAA